MQARIKWVENMAFVAESGSGHAVVIDGPPEIGGGACSSVDVVMILKKARQPVSDCYCELNAERAETEPKVFTSIHLRFVVSGSGLNPAQVERAVKLSAEKYCSASIMLANAGVRISHDFEIREPS